MKHIKLFEAFDTEEDVEVENWEDVDISDALEKKLICYNDDVNTFDHVIECFMDILGHTMEQSEQLAIIIHTKGKAVVKMGPLEKLQQYLEALTRQKLSCKIEE